MSFIINSLKFENKDLKFSTNKKSSENTFTIFTGKNGVGKTKILSSIVRFFLIKEVSQRNVISETLTILNTEIEAKVNYTRQPDKIIVHTNSKHNKFPSKYHYPSAKNYFNLDESNYYYNPRTMDNNFFTQLVNYKKINFKTVSDTFSYLNYQPLVRIDLKLDWISFPAGYYSRTIEKYKSILIEELNFDLNKTLKQASKVDRYFIATLNYISSNSREEISISEIKLLYSAFKSFDIINLSMLVEVDFNQEIFKYTNTNKSIIKLFFKFNIIRFSSVFLYKGLENSYSPFFTNKGIVNFNDLSSGQQAIFNTLLGISGVISNNSLICIDEPEISLHPEWQSDIINKLQSVFQDIKGCHFLIATHSPQVVASLKSENSFIVNLEKMETYNASEHNHKSADYQLAKIFDTPGYNNEFLIRICLVIITKISKREKFNSDDYNNLILLKEVKNSINHEDSVHLLIEQILSMVE